MNKKVMRTEKITVEQIVKEGYIVDFTGNSYCIQDENGNILETGVIA